MRKLLFAREGVLSSAPRIPGVLSESVGQPRRLHPKRGKTRRRSRFLLVLALALVPFALAAPASATQPTVESFHFEGTAPWASCEGFDIVVNFTLDIVERTFYESTGQPIRIQAQFQGEGQLVNSVTGASNMGKSPTMDISDLQAGTVTTVGLVFHNNVPGEGIVALQAGRITFNEDGNVLFSAGPQPGSRRHRLVRHPGLTPFRLVMPIGSIAQPARPSPEGESRPGRRIP